MARISREALNIQIAMLIAQRGTCARLQVGAVLTLNNKIISTGYNGPGPTEPHCNNFICDTLKPCSRAKHAEANAINNLMDNTLYSHLDLLENSLTLYCTHAPCMGCAILLESLINTVYYLHNFRDFSGLDLLKRAGITCIQINENGIPQN
jgi:dCMP deaminase